MDKYPHLSEVNWFMTFNLPLDTDRSIHSIVSTKNDYVYTKTLNHTFCSSYVFINCTHTTHGASNLRIEKLISTKRGKKFTVVDDVRPAMTAAASIKAALMAIVLINN